MASAIALGYPQTMLWHIRRSAPALLAALLLPSMGALLAVARPAPRVINVTSDSQPGWTPSVELEQQARAVAMAYLAAMDSGKYNDAYGMIADLNRKDQPLPVFTDRIGKFNALAGAVIERRIVTVTWTKNPAHAPAPGVYVALDLVSRFTNIDRHCGYLVLYQSPSGGDFHIMREENNFFDNASAADIKKKSGSAAVDRAWAAASSHCPGYQPPLPEASGPTTGYASVAAALAALHAKPGVVFRQQSGWTIAEDDAAMTIWSFTPPDNPAYPAVVKRQILSKDGATSIDTSVHCEASKEACDNLVRSFNQLNAQIGNGLHDR